MNSGNIIHSSQYRFYCYKRLLREYIQVFIFFSKGRLDVSSIKDEIGDIKLIPTEPEYISFSYSGSADKLRVCVKFITQDSKGEEMPFVINNKKAIEMKRCNESFQIPQKKSICYFKLSIMDEVTGQQIKEETVYLQKVQESRAPAENSYLGRMLNCVTGIL